MTAHRDRRRRRHIGTIVWIAGLVILAVAIALLAALAVAAVFPPTAAADPDVQPALAPVVLELEPASIPASLLR